MKLVLLRVPYHLLLVLACVWFACGGCALFRPSAEERLRSAMLKEDPAERRESLIELEGELTAAMRPGLEQMMKRDADPTVRALAAEWLGELGSPLSVAELRASARTDSHWMVRGRAARSLARILKDEARDDLKFILENDPGPRVRVEAVKLAASWLPFDTASPLLLAALQKDGANEVRLQAHLELKRLTGQSLPPDYESWEGYLKGRSTAR